MTVHVTHELSAKLEGGDTLHLTPNGDTDTPTYKDLYIGINGDGYSLPLEDVPHIVTYLTAFYNMRVTKDKTI